MDDKSGISVFERLLQLIDSETAQGMLEDLKNKDKRTPQLYNAVTKYLDRHGASLTKVSPDEDILGELADALPELTEDEKAGVYEMSNYIN